MHSAPRRNRDDDPLPRSPGRPAPRSPMPVVVRRRRCGGLSARSAPSGSSATSQAGGESLRVGSPLRPCDVGATPVSFSLLQEQRGPREHDHQSGDRYHNLGHGGSSFRHNPPNAAASEQRRNADPALPATPCTSQTDVRPVRLRVARVRFAAGMRLPLRCSMAHRRRHGPAMAERTSRSWTANVGGVRPAVVRLVGALEAVAHVTWATDDAGYVEPQKRETGPKARPARSVSLDTCQPFGR